MHNHDEKNLDPQSRLVRKVEEVAGKRKQKGLADDRLVMRMPPARTCGAEYTWDSCSFILNEAREAVTANAARSHPRTGEEVKILVKNKTKLLNDRDWRKKSMFSNGGLTQLSMTRPRSPRKR